MRGRKDGKKRLQQQFTNKKTLKTVRLRGLWRRMRDSNPRYLTAQ